MSTGSFSFPEIYWLHESRADLIHFTRRSSNNTTTFDQTYDAQYDVLSSMLKLTSAVVGERPLRTFSLLIILLHNLVFFLAEFYRTSKTASRPRITRPGERGVGRPNWRFFFVVLMNKQELMGLRKGCSSPRLDSTDQSDGLSGMRYPMLLC